MIGSIDMPVKSDYGRALDFSLTIRKQDYELEVSIACCKIR